MKNLKIYSLTEINKSDAALINGGHESWLSQLGAAAHGAWGSFISSLPNTGTQGSWGAFYGAPPKN